MKKTISLDRLRQVAKYDPLTGLFTARIERGKNCCKISAGQILGSIGGRGYRAIVIDGRKYASNRLVWFHCHGTWPVGKIDHKDGDKANDRIDNLRDVTTKVNAENQRKANKDNRSGYLGVGWDKQTGKWRAGITRSGKYTCLGRYDDPLEAHQAYLKAKREMHVGCTI